MVELKFTAFKFSDCVHFRDTHDTENVITQIYWIDQVVKKVTQMRRNVQLPCPKKGKFALKDKNEPQLIKNLVSAVNSKDWNTTTDKLIDSFQSRMNGIQDRMSKVDGDKDTFNSAIAPFLVK